MTSPAVKASDGFQFVASLMVPSGLVCVLTPDRNGSGRTVEVPGTEVWVMPSGVSSRSPKLSAMDVPVTFSITIPSST